MLANSRVNEINLVNSCRICLKLHDDPIESHQTFMDRDIQTIFYEITLLKLPLEKHLPFKICQTCRKNLHSTHLFLAALIQVQTQLNSLIDTSLLKQENEAIADYLKELFIIQNANISCPKTSPENQVTVVLDIFTHLETVMTEEYVETCNTEEVFKDKDNPLEQLNQSAASKKKSIPARVKKLKDSAATDEMLTNFRGKLKALRKKRKSKPLKPCPNCYKKRATEYHLSLHNSKPVACELCKKVCRDRYVLDRHKSRCATSKLEFCCEEISCGKRILGLQNYRNHQKSHLPNEQRKYRCDQCEKAFNIMAHLTNHQLSHNPVWAYLCHLCASSFQQKYNLQCHLLKHHADMLTDKELPQLRCECCDRMFLNTAALKVHLTRRKSRNDNGPAAKMPTNKSKSNRSKPGKARMISCEFCQQVLPNKEAFRKHIRQHKFNCGVCHKMFVDIEKFRKHTLMHDNEPKDGRNLHCPEPGCTAKFSKSYCLKMHKMKHANEFPCPCTDCEKRFKCSSELNKHRMRKHKQTTKNVSGTKVKREHMVVLESGGVKFKRAYTTKEEEKGDAEIYDEEQEFLEEWLDSDPMEEV